MIDVLLAAVLGVILGAIACVLWLGRRTKSAFMVEVRGPTGCPEVHLVIDGVTHEMTCDSAQELGGALVAASFGQRKAGEA